MNKAQSNIISVVLMSGIAIIIVAATLIWGKPLIDKSADKISMQNILNTLEKIDGKIVYVASNTGSQRIRVDITGLSEISVDEADNSIIFKTNTRAPLVGSSNWVPISTYELPTEEEIITINTTNTICTCGSCFSPYNPYCGSGAVHYGAKTINQTGTTFSVFSTNGVEYNRICYNVTSDIPSSHCFLENGVMYFNGTDYKIIYIDPLGNEVVLEGAEVENIGVQGKDIPGILIGKMYPGQDMYEVNLKLKYRGLEDENSITHRIKLTCGTNCISTSGNKFMKMSYNNTKTTSTTTETYIKVEFE